MEAEQQERSVKAEERPQAARLDRLSQLRSTARSVLDPLIPQGARCALLDFPEYSNVGDSAIWLGQLEYLKSRHARVIYASSCQSYNKEFLNKVVGNGCLLLSGGGNFGDIWPIHQKFREQVIADFPNNPIIQLPQSIHFGVRQNMKTARSVIGGHHNIKILTRDRQSSILAEQALGADVQICPDMSIFLDVKRCCAPTERLIILARTDTEKQASMAAPGAIRVMDWLEERRPRLIRLCALVHFGLRWCRTGAGFWILSEAGNFAMSQIARERLSRGLRILSRGRIVITDRLHAMILCWLSGIPVLFLDNCYGKLSAFAELWLSGADKPVQCNSIEQAITHAGRLTLPASASLQAD